LSFADLTEAKRKKAEIPDQRLPQQDPGPAQPALEGELPQQVVSPGPGTPPVLAFPVSELVLERSFSIFRLPQAGHALWPGSPIIKSSETFPQSRHL
jgi:hypothetical protein